MAEKQSRNFLGVIYPDSTTYDCDKVLLRIEDTFSEYAYILHDMDTDENGELKKPHYHWCGKRTSPTLLSTVANALGVEQNSIEFCKRWKSSLRYLVHADNQEKHQYSLDNLFANFDVETIVGKSETYKSRQIFEYIKENPSISYTQLTDWCFENNVWSEFRRSFSVWANLLRELNYFSSLEEKEKK